MCTIQHSNMIAFTVTVTVTDYLFSNVSQRKMKPHIERIERTEESIYAFYAFYAWWFYFP
jgi:hypothetical protein